MANHAHLPFTTPSGDLARGMHSLNTRFARSFNRRHEYSGHLFEARYHAVVVKDDLHFVELLRYLALNPVRAGVCTSPLEWPWSSYPAAVGDCACPDFLTLGGVLGAFSQNTERAREGLRCFVQPSTPLKRAWHQEE